MIPFASEDGAEGLKRGVSPRGEEKRGRRVETRFVQDSLFRALLPAEEVREGS